MCVCVCVFKHVAFVPKNLGTSSKSCGGLPSRYAPNIYMRGGNQPCISALMHANVFFLTSHYCTLPIIRLYSSSEKDKCPAQQQQQQHDDSVERRDV